MPAARPVASVTSITIRRPLPFLHARTPMAHKIAAPNLPNLLLKAREAMLTQFRPIITHFGLTEQQWRILRILSDAGELEQRELSEACLILGPSLTGVLARMEEMDLIVRTRMAQDQRRVRVRMSALGGKVVATLGPLILEQYRNIEKVLGKALMAEVAATMERFIAVDVSAIRQVALPDAGKIDHDVARLMK